MTLPFPYGVSETRGFYQCTCDPTHLTDVHAAQKLVALVDQSGFTVMGQHIQSFGDGSGYTLNITLGESGAAFDCWPEKHAVWVFLDYCNYTGDNSTKAEKFWQMATEFFAPTESRILIPPTILPLE
jgi:S-adenosylmethionine/arginine decarboxylase-like enzyme